jgi:hypothetical protein
LCFHAASLPEVHVTLPAEGDQKQDDDDALHAEMERTRDEPARGTSLRTKDCHGVHDLAPGPPPWLPADCP